MLFVQPQSLTAQKSDPGIKAELDKMISESYGPDQELVNGIEYFNLHTRSSGHKFLDEDQYYPGRVVIDKKVYTDVFIKYNIFNQEVLLLTDHPLGGNRQLILNNLRITEFEINGRIFRKYTFPGSRTLFYQVIGNNNLACLYHFYKQEIPRAVDQDNLSEFTEVQKKSYLLRGAGLYAFKSNRSFIRIFPDHQSQIKSYISQNKLKVRNLDDLQMTRLISFCESLFKVLLEE